VGKCYETVRRWTEWYRSGGLEEVLSRRHGGSGGRERRLSEDEEQALLERAREGKLRTIWDGVEWARSEAGVEYSYWGMRPLYTTKKSPAFTLFGDIRRESLSNQRKRLRTRLRCG